jgi:hypothetical protein
MRLLVWTVAAVLALLWTGGAALLASLVQLAVHGVAAGAGVSLPAAADPALPRWLAGWIDPAWWQAALQSASSAWAAASAWAPALSTAIGWLEPAIWAAWAAGIVALLALAGLATWLVGRVVSHDAAKSRRDLQPAAATSTRRTSG